MEPMIYTSQEMVKAPIVTGRAWENIAPIGRAARWVSKPTIPGELDRIRAALADTGAAS